MRGVLRLIAGAVAVLMVAATATPASATPRPRSEEWWFSAWGIEKDVWPLTTGKGVTVAVLDTGVNAALPELSGAVLKGADTSGGKTDGRKDLDERDGGHGTAMAALIAGQGGGETGFVGVAPDAKILPVHDSSKLGDKNGIYESFAKGIRFSVDHGAKVINISQGVTSEMMDDHCESGVQEAIGYAIDRDVVVVASSGDTGNTTNWPELPGSCAGVLAVGGIDPALRPWNGTQRQPYVAIAAPGDQIPTIGKKGSYYPNSWGTSASAALTSGAIAFIRARNPRMSARTVVQRLIATARPLTKDRWNSQTGFGAIQITSAMNPGRYMVPADAPNPVYESFRRWRQSRYGAALGPVAHSPKPRSSSSAGSSRLNESSIFLVGIGVLILLAIAALGVVIAVRRRSRSPMTNSE